MAFLRRREPGAQRLLARCCLAIGFLALAAPRAGADEVKRVLILYSNESILPANIALGNAIVGHMWADLPGRAEFFSEFLDLVGFSGEAHQRRTVAANRAKYSGPGMSGLDLYRRLASSIEDVPVIFITVHDAPAARKEAELMGARSYLTKPFSWRTLLDAVRQAVGSH